MLLWLSYTDCFFSFYIIFSSINKNLISELPDQSPRVIKLIDFSFQLMNIKLSSTRSLMIIAPKQLPHNLPLFRNKNDEPMEYSLDLEISRSAVGDSLTARQRLLRSGRLRQGERTNFREGIKSCESPGTSCCWEEFWSFHGYCWFGIDTIFTAQDGSTVIGKFQSGNFVTVTSISFYIAGI